MEKKKGDELWDLRKQQANKVAELYSLLGFTDEWYKIKNCSTELKFIHGYPSEGGAAPQRLVSANFCRLRMCPVCQWRRSIRWQAKAFQSLTRIMQTYPTKRWLFLTLTVKNCPLEELRMQIDRMNHGFSKWTQGKEWPATGWIKSLEITRGTDDTGSNHIYPS